ncbi:CYTH and CHAD domain-containing protein [Streptomyces paludis]|uniref:CHAD domain-containing protein n=1 Tax=Streptomyces paludis TaxID=2282738 RepID=A0A345HMA8_9ACTN|nr:CYTH and CHAD domain-containing protein [Streptomyces paludis]AXG77832.1 CHAD domain-containing protein [Streptomyces paludis]
MARTEPETVRETERKYTLPPGAVALPDLAGAGGAVAVLPQGRTELDAVYHDTADLRLAAASVTLRRRTGGADAGWHLKLPVAAGVRDEIRAPLSETVPDALVRLVRSRTRDAPLVPVVRLRSTRAASRLYGAGNALLAEVSVDTVRAARLGADSAPTGATAAWTEAEAELGPEAGPAVLDALDARLRAAGLRPARYGSKQARALAETGFVVAAGEERPPVTAGDHVVAYARAQTAALVALDPAVRRDLPDAVHQMRVASRRLRSALRTYRSWFDRAVTEPLGEELRWLAAELGVDRDHEVLSARLAARIDALPGPLLTGPVRARLGAWHTEHRTGSRARTLAVLDSARYLALLDALDAFLAAPPAGPGAGAAPAEALAGRVLAAYGRVKDRIEDATALAPGPARDLALHSARKAAKRARYAAEAARPVLGGPAGRFARRMKDVQTVLGEHQDSVVARETLRDLARAAHAAGESAFTWGLLYGEEAARGERLERELPRVWMKAADRRIRAALNG